eukprot:SAG11_NODE_104_length_16539_cov_8.526642_13_plen_104_part_00
MEYGNGGVEEPVVTADGGESKPIGMQAMHQIDLSPPAAPAKFETPPSEQQQQRQPTIDDTTSRHDSDSRSGSRLSLGGFGHDSDSSSGSSSSSGGSRESSSSW